VFRRPRSTCRCRSHPDTRANAREGIRISRIVCRLTSLPLTRAGTHAAKTIRLNDTQVGDEPASARTSRHHRPCASGAARPARRGDQTVEAPDAAQEVGRRAAGSAVAVSLDAGAGCPNVETKQ
jgi:hypothetical protein